MPLAPCEIKLGAQATRAEECHPTLVPVIQLRCTADRVVETPAERRLSRAVLPRKLLTENAISRTSRRAALAPLERKPGFASARADTHHSRYADGLCTPQFFKPGRFRLEHGAAPRWCNFYEKRARIALPAVALVDRATVTSAGGLRGRRTSRGSS